METSVEDPFDICECGHTRRCHDSAGCAKWIKADIAILGQGIYMQHRIINAHTCPCNGFRRRDV